MAKKSKSKKRPVAKAKRRTAKKSAAKKKARPVKVKAKSRVAKKAVKAAPKKAKPKAKLAAKKAVPDAFVCLESQSCAEIADALDRANVRGKTIVAMDTIDTTISWIQKGMIRATIAQKPYTMAYYGLRAIDDR